MTTNNQIATDLILGLISHGGATIDPRTGITPRDGFMVGMAGHGMSSPVPVDGRHSVALVANWLTSEHETLSSLNNVYVGSWRDEDGNRDYFDLSLRFSSRDLALAAARQTGELAIFDLATMSEIRA